MGAALQDQVNAAIASHNYEAVAKVLDAAELQACDPAVFANGWPHALHLAGHLYNKQLTDARFVWKRIPLNIKQADQELLALGRVLQCLWESDFQAMWPALKRPWSAGLQPIMVALAEKLRGERLEMIGTAYSAVKPAKVAALCGMTEQDARAACLALGWVWSEATGTLQVVRPEPPAVAPEGDQGLGSLTQYMVHLEH